MSDARALNNKDHLVGQLTSDARALDTAGTDSSPTDRLAAEPWKCCHLHIRFAIIGVIIFPAKFTLSHCLRREHNGSAVDEVGI